jgi:hypothetical protein
MSTAAAAAADQPAGGHLVKVKVKHGAEFHRFSAPYDDFDNLLDIVKAKFPEAEDCVVKYQDLEGDMCSITNATELDEAIAINLSRDGLLRLFYVPRDAKGSPLPAPTSSSGSSLSSSGGKVAVAAPAKAPEQPPAQANDDWALASTTLKAMVSAKTKVERELHTMDIGSSFYTEKGLVNAGQNNCFLNVVIQAFWNIQAFWVRFKFTDETRHLHNKESCVFCPLKFLFSQYKYSTKDAVPPTEVRQTLAQLFASDHRFQIGQMDDAAEAYSGILEHLHNSFAGRVAIEKGVPAPDPKAPSKEGVKEFNCGPCLAHEVFGITLSEQTTCECGVTSKPLEYKTFIHYVSAAALREHQSKSKKKLGLGQLLQKCVDTSADVKSCPKDEETKCTKKATTSITLTTSPFVYALGLVWENADTKREAIAGTMDLISAEFNMSDVFPTGTGVYQLRGIVCFFGRHYISYFYRPLAKKWVCFDDSSHREVGSDWSSVADKVKAGRYQPSVIFYEKVDEDIAASSD